MRKNLIVKNDGMKLLQARLEKLSRRGLYVGIPAEKASRRGGKINNAELAFILTHGVRTDEARRISKTLAGATVPNLAVALYLRAKGSPLYRTPPRPIIEPAIAAPDNRTAIAREIASAVTSGLAGKDEESMRHLKRAGLEAQNRVRAWFTDPRNDWPANAPSTVKRKGSSRPNIDKGELRKSIVYVIRDNE